MLVFREGDDLTGILGVGEATVILCLSVSAVAWQQEVYSSELVVQQTYRYCWFELPLSCIRNSSSNFPTK